MYNKIDIKYQNKNCVYKLNTNFLKDRHYFVKHLKGDYIMKNKKSLSKKIAGFVLAIVSILTGNNVYAGISLPSNMSDVYSASDPVASSIGGQIIWVAQIILYAVAVIIVMFAGVKYMGTAPEAKAEFKKKLIYMTVGAVILFAAGSLVRIIGGMAMSNV